MKSVAGKDSKSTALSPAPHAVEVVIVQRPVTPESRAKFEAALARNRASIDASRAELEAQHAAD